MLFQSYSPKNNARLVGMILEVLALPLVTNNVVNSLKTMERKIKEFERYANIEIPEFLKIGIVIRQEENGPMRTHLIINSHRMVTFFDVKTEVTNVKQAQSAVTAKTGDAMDVDAFAEGSSRGRVLVLREAGPSSFRLPQETEGPRQRTVEGFEETRQRMKRQQVGVQGQAKQLWQDRSHAEGLQIQRNECIRGEEGLAETQCIDMASIDLIALEIGAVQLPEKDRKIRVGIDSCAAVTVFPKTVADDCPMLQTPGKARQRVTGRRQTSFCWMLVCEKCRASSGMCYAGT